MSELEAADGVVEVGRVLPRLACPWAVLPAGPRRWTPSDLWAEEGADRAVVVVRMTYRSAPDRAVVVAGVAAGTPVDPVAERAATPLLFAELRRRSGGPPPTAVLAALEARPEWEDADEWDIAPAPAPGRGWVAGRAGVGYRHVRLARRQVPGGWLLLVAQGVAAEELAPLARGLVVLGQPGADEAFAELAVRHRRALAQRWWDAPRTPWVPAQRTG